MTWFTAESCNASAAQFGSACRASFTIPRCLLSVIRLPFWLRERRPIRRRTDFVVGLLPCGRPRAGLSGDRRFGNVAITDNGSISFVSYPPLQVS
jgi:hypothetical protein